jgi:hypothetical protein
MLKIQKGRASFKRKTAHTFAHDALGAQGEGSMMVKASRSLAFPSVAGSFSVRF